MAKDKDRLTPPYIPWKTFTGYIDYLKNAGPVPPRRIDTSMMPHSMSGAVRSQLRSALRFLGLIEADGTVGESFVTLIESYGTDAWKSTILKMVNEAYATVIAGVDIESGTAGQLSEAFGKAGVDGDVRFKAVRFFLSATQATGLTVSPYFVQRGAKTFGRKSARKKNGRQNAAPVQASSDDDEEEEEDFELPSGMTRWPIPIPGKRGAVIAVPDDVNDDDWTMIDTVVRAYIARAAKVSQQTE